MDFIDVQRKLVEGVLRLPLVASFNGRTSLLQGLPPNIPLQRAEDNARLDLNNIVSGLDRLGRLTKAGGVRPLVIVVDNAIAYVPDGSDIDEELREVRALLEAHYGGDIQAPVEGMLSEPTLEALVFGAQRDARVSFTFVQHAYTTARSVARITTPRVLNAKPDGTFMYGTGWIIAPGLLITNHHVIDARDRRPRPFGPAEDYAAPADLEAQASGAIAEFGYFSEADLPERRCKVSQLLAFSRQLDYAILEMDGADAIADRASLPLATEVAMNRGSRVNIAQHPNGGPLRFAIRNNFFVRPDGESPFIFYQTDTEPGASGSPVCTDDWQVLALHHASQSVPAELVPQETIDGSPSKVTILNRAVNIQAVMDDLTPEIKQRILAAQVN